MGLELVEAVMFPLELTRTELDILLGLTQSAPVRGVEGMKAMLALIEKLTACSQGRASSG